MKVDKNSDATTVISIPMNSEDREGDWTIKYTQRKAGTDAWENSMSEIKIRSFYDVCAPDMIVTPSSFQDSEYIIDEEKLSIPLLDFGSNNCESDFEFYVDDVLQSPNSEEEQADWINCDGCTNGYGNKINYFTPSTPKLYVGTTATRDIKLEVDSSDYSLAKVYTIKVIFFTVVYKGEENTNEVTHFVEKTFSLELIDPRCIPDLVPPPVSQIEVSTYYTRDYTNF